MEKTYVITWKSKLGALTRQGTKHFTRDEAQALAEELNQEHPDIFHEVLNLAPTPEEPAVAATLNAPAQDTIVRGVDFGGANTESAMPETQAAAMA